jgi:hypothetical protein
MRMRTRSGWARSSRASGGAARASRGSAALVGAISVAALFDSTLNFLLLPIGNFKRRKLA